MKTLITPIIMALLTVTTSPSQTVNFDADTPGKPPTGWTATKTGTGNPKWTVEKEGTAPSKPNVLKQSGVATYPICLLDSSSLKDGFVEVRFKPIARKEDH